MSTEDFDLYEIRNAFIGLVLGFITAAVGLLLFVAITALFLGAAWAMLISMYYLTMP